MTYTLSIGEVRCHIVSDGRHYLDGGGFFGLVPRALWQRIIQPNNLNQIPVETRSLLIESDAGLVLVDTGIGDKLSQSMRKILGMGEVNGRLVGDLRRLGFAPEDVSTVLLTHLHNDHAGGATKWLDDEGVSGEAEPVFPNARYIVQRVDLSDAVNPNERTAATYFSENWQPLLDRGLLDVVDGPLQLGSAIHTEIAPGHTEAFQVVWVESAGECLLYLGDACSWAVHLERLAWVPAFDILPMQSIETKRRLRQRAFEKNALLLFQHDAQLVTGRLAAGDRGPVVTRELTEDAWLDAH